MIVAKECDNQPRIQIVMHGGMRTEADTTYQGNSIHKWERKVAEPLHICNPRKEKETYQKERKELMGVD
jgi:hypothetical protein